MATKAELIEKLAEKTNSTKVAAAEQYEIFVSSIIELLQEGQPVALQGVGTLSIKSRPARTARNPRTGASVTVAATRGVRLAVSPALKKGLNGK